MTRMSMRTIAKQLVPPIVWSVLRKLRRPPPVVPAVPAMPAEHLVLGGDLKGHRLLVNDRMPAFREMIEGSYDTYIQAACGRVDVRGDRVLDIGSHIGFHALSFVARWPQAHVIAFEPSPVNLERCTRNMELNRDLSQRITVKPFALGDRQGSAQFNCSTNVEDQTSSGGFLDEASKPLDDAIYRKAGFIRYQVQVRTLDAVAEEENWGRVALIKLDVEGAEHLVLHGAKELLSRDRPYLLIEVHSVRCMLEVQNLLHPLGYRTTLLHEDRASRCFIQAEASA